MGNKQYPFLLWRFLLLCHCYLLFLSFLRQHDPLAEEVTSEVDENLNYVEAYSYSNHESALAIMNWSNANRYAHSNLYNDAAAMRSAKTVTDAERTAAAMLNQNFRMAVALSYDRFSYMSVLYFHCGCPCECRIYPGKCIQLRWIHKKYG